MTPSSSAQTFAETKPSLVRNFLDTIEWFDEIGSTNDYLLAQPAPSTGQGRVAVAKHQTAGRGRRGQRWLSSSVSSICLSMCHTFVNKPENVAGIGLAVGASIAAALKNIGADKVALKWPNDLMIEDAKLAGILAESHTIKSGQSTVVVGVGLNIDLNCNPQPFSKIVQERAVGDLAGCLTHLPSYEEIANLLIDAMHRAFVEFGSRGFDAFVEDWQSFDWLSGKFVEIDEENQCSAGICEGIDVDGALLLNTKDGTQRIISGSVRIVDPQTLAARK